jgi:YfiH family protein
MTDPAARQAPALAAPGIRHGFFGRDGGVSGGIYASLNCGYGSADAPEAVRENRSRVAAALGVGHEALLTVHQAHSAVAVAADAPWPARQPPRADAMVTRRPGLALGVLAADCAPVLFADAEAGVVGAAHAGWRGALDGVLSATVTAMTRLGARPERIAAAIGPCIGQASYEVGPEFRARFLAVDDGHERHFAAGDGGRFRFDLPGFVAARLAAAGLAAVTRLDIDTYPEKNRQFSYRRATHRGEPDYGRAISAIVLAR